MDKLIDVYPALQVYKKKVYRPKGKTSYTNVRLINTIFMSVALGKQIKLSPFFFYYISRPPG